MGLVVCNATSQDIHCQGKGSALSSLKLPMKVWYLWLPLHPCASSLDAQVLAGLTGSHSWQPQQGTRPGSKANTQFGYTTFIKCFGKFTHHSWDFQGLPNICLMFKHVFTYRRLCAEHLIPTKDFFWPIWNMLLSPQLWNTAFWSHKSCNSPSHPIPSRMTGWATASQGSGDGCPVGAAQAGMPCRGPAWEGGGTCCSCQERMGVCNLPGFIFVFLTETALLV